MTPNIKVLLLSLLCLCGESTFAQTICYSDHRQKGIEAYKEGDYKLAKKHFEFILNSCDDKPAVNDIQRWIDKCNAALKPTTTTPRTSNSTTEHNTGNKTTSSGSVNNRQNVTPYLYVGKTYISCSANGITETIAVTCNGNWSIQYPSSSMYSATRSGNGIQVHITANTSTSSRSDFFNVVCGDKVIKISLSQSGRQNNSNSNTSQSTTTNSAPTLSVNKTSIIIGSSGTTEYLTVNSNRAWEIQFPTGGMYSATRSGNTIKVVINQNTTTNSRQDFFNVRLTDGSKVIRVNIWQSGRTTTSQSSSSYGSSSSRSNYSNRTSNQSTYHQSAYQRFINTNGSVAITWFGMSGEIGTGATFTESLLRFRLGPIELRPLDITGGYNFIYGTTYFAYQPILDFYIPTSSDKALYFGAGPSIGSGDREFWFRAEGGLHWEWGVYASSDFYFRYDGMYTAGVSIQWSSKWR